ncbi:hypothetical protein [Photobacterium carnosum]|uniref:Uncharacterized protein n=1 Tax=Photobacterium carnosum TaxID=2023717 RepID=A0A2N4UM64_9GAMM|nr:hypothetical protein [Photobacterium carnosum]PLC56102.1 hypothetical protein CIK00_20175 [Photobacterium carnosum]
MLSRIFVTGEGITDIGRALNQVNIAHDENFEHGPFYTLVERLVKRHLPSWHDELPFAVTFVYRKALGELTKDKDVPTRFPSKDRALKGHLDHTKRAFALALIANDNMEQGQSHMAIYFHDTDGTRSELEREPERQKNRAEAVKLGFETAGYENGVAMIPKPTSEAWLYCSCKDNPYLACDLLETALAGNQNSKDRSPKAILANAIGKDSTNRENLRHLVDALDIDQLDMPSFNMFKKELKNSIRRICGEVED